MKRFLVLLAQGLLRLLALFPLTVLRLRPDPPLPHFVGARKGRPASRPAFPHPRLRGRGAERSEAVRGAVLAYAAVLSVMMLACAPAFAFDPFEAAGIDRHPGARVPLDLTFQDATGNRVTLAELGDGKPMLLIPVLHDCPNICGVTLSGLAQAIRAQAFKPDKDFAVVAFGIDPKEGPAQARASLADLTQAFPEFGNHVHALTGSAENIEAVTGVLGYRYAWDERIGQYAHVAATAVLTPDGHLARWLYGLNPEPTDLRLALTEAGQGRIGDWRDQLLLLCYHYDPETGRYGSLIWTLLRIGGGLTVAAGLSLIGIAVFRERRAGGSR